MVGCVSRNGKALIFVSGSDSLVPNFPLRNFKSRNSQGAEIRSDIIRHAAQVLPNDACSAGLFQNNSQVFLPVAFICFAVFRRFVVTRNEMRRPATGLLEHLILIERQKMLVLPWPPRKGVDAIKSQHVIDAEEMKNAPD